MRTACFLYLLDCRLRHITRTLVSLLTSRLSLELCIFELLQTLCTSALLFVFHSSQAKSVRRQTSSVKSDSHWGLIPEVGSSHFSLLCQKISAPGGGKSVPFFANKPPLTYAILCSSTSAVERIALMRTSQSYSSQISCHIWRNREIRFIVGATHHPQSPQKFRWTGLPLIVSWSLYIFGIPMTFTSFLEMGRLMENLYFKSVLKPLPHLLHDGTMKEYKSRGRVRNDIQTSTWNSTSKTVAFDANLWVFVLGNFDWDGPAITSPSYDFIGYHGFFVSLGFALTTE